MSHWRLWFLQHLDWGVCRCVITPSLVPCMPGLLLICCIAICCMETEAGRQCRSESVCFSIAAIVCVPQSRGTLPIRQRILLPQSGHIFGLDLGYCEAWISPGCVQHKNLSGFRHGRRCSSGWVILDQQILLCQTPLISKSFHRAPTWQESRSQLQQDMEMWSDALNFCVCRNWTFP